MGTISDLRQAVAMITLAAVVGLVPACGGGPGADTVSELQTPASAGLALEGRRVAGRDEALQLVAAGIVAPLYCSELAHAVLARAFDLREHSQGAAFPASAGDRWALGLDTETLGARATLEGTVSIDIEAADHAEGLILHGEPGHLRAVLRLHDVALDAVARIDGAIVLEVSRAVAGAGQARRSQADVLSVSDGSRTLRWSYLDIRIGTEQDVQTLNVVSAVPMDGADEVWLDVTSTAPDRPTDAPAGAKLSSRRYTATGVIGFLKARLALQVAADGGWTINVDNERDDRVDFVVQASPDEVRRSMTSTGTGLISGCAGQ